MMLDGGVPDSLFIVWMLASIAGTALNDEGNVRESQVVVSRRLAKLVVECSKREQALRRSEAGDRRFR